jgi:acetyl esterase/lipase
MRRTGRRTTTIGWGLALTIAVGAGPAAAAAPQRGAACVPDAPRTTAYRVLPGVARNLTSLDLYVPPRRCRRAAGAPVVAWVHGGGYHRGDKAQQVADKVSLFTRRGWIFASVNYRLTRPRDPASARYPDHYDDVATAVTWLRRHVRGRGGNPRRIALLGHSAGADIVSNVAVDPQHLARHGQRLGALRCFAPLDTAGFEKPRASAREQVQWRSALGNQPGYRISTSATLIARRGTGIAPALTVYRGTPHRQLIETRFAARLRAIGVPVTLVDARSLSHGEVNRRIGAPGDKVMTPPLLRFLRKWLAA